MSSSIYLHRSRSDVRQAMPAGFRYAPDLIDDAEDARLVKAFADPPFKKFEFHGLLGAAD